MTSFKDLARMFGNHDAPSPPIYHHPYDHEGSHGGLSLLAARLRIKEGDILPFQFLQAAKKDNGTGWVVFVMQSNMPIVLEDSEELFPSDALISKLNMLRK